MHSTTLLLPPPEDMPFMDHTGDLSQVAAWVTVENLLCLRTSASPKSPVFGKLERYTLLRVIGNPRYHGRLLCARVEVLSHASKYCGIVAYTALEDSANGGRALCKLAGETADEYLRDGRLHQFQWGLGPTIIDDSFPSEDPEDPDPRPIETEVIELLQSMLLASLPLKEHFLALIREEQQSVRLRNR
eukprot:285636-Amphidinium_carterae.1